MQTLHLRNPHSVLAAIKARPHDVSAVRVGAKSADTEWRKVAQAASEHGIRVEMQRTRPQSDKRKQDRDGRTGAGEADVKPREDVSIKDLFAEANDHGLWIAFDHLQDPHNVGAIFRTAAFFGVRGILMTKDQSAPLTSTVYDVAAGGLEAVPFSIQSNLSRSLQIAKDAGLWVLGTSEHAEKDVSAVPSDRAWLLVVGNEQKGLRQLTSKNCDDVCRLTPRGDVTSLNVSVATGILIETLTRSEQG
ncbi:MAG: 23S rRNA (guanosine(2251)-2'-O)-methyltransferase RlmB [Planctomycetaceae bacterium]|nr:23S rRNA (guanosine(2251)-2'-O)-methyltransferase RlmB [Planctomycetaceae bacterium]